MATPATYRRATAKAAHHETVPITSHPRGLRFCRACGARLTLRSGNPATKTVSLWSGHLAMTVPRASIDERPTRSSLAGRPYLPHLQSTRTGKPAGHPATAPTGDSDEPPVWTRVVRSTTPVVQMNPDDRRLPRDSFAAIPDSSSQSDGGIHRYAPPGAQLRTPKDPAGPKGSTRLDCDRLGRHPLSSSRIWTTVDHSAVPSCDDTGVVITVPR